MCYIVIGFAVFIQSIFPLLGKRCVVKLPKVFCMLMEHHSIADILRALDHKLDCTWQEFGTFLGVEYHTMNSIDSEQRGRPRFCMLHLVGSWLSHQTGTGDLPRTWETVVEAVRDAGSQKLAMELAEKHGVTLTLQ